MYDDHYLIDFNKIIFNFISKSISLFGIFYFHYFYHILLCLLNKLFSLQVIPLIHLEFTHHLIYFNEICEFISFIHIINSFSLSLQKFTYMISSLELFFIGKLIKVINQESQVFCKILFHIIYSLRQIYTFIYN